MCWEIDSNISAILVFKNWPTGNLYVTWHISNTFSMSARLTTRITFKTKNNKTFPISLFDP